MGMTPFRRSETMPVAKIRTLTEFGLSAAALVLVASAVAFAGTAPSVGTSVPERAAATANVAQPAVEPAAEGAGRRVCLFVSADGRGGANAPRKSCRTTR